MILRGLAVFVLICFLTTDCSANRRQGRGKKKLPENLEVRTDKERKGKFFNLFNVVTFDNGPCRSTSSISGDVYRNGTCLTSTECNDRGGQINGNCAAGFGACCVFVLNNESGGTISQNCTYIQNPGYPSASTSSSSLSYIVNKCNDEVCMLRLDFETFTLQGPTVTTEALGGTCPDSFKVTTNSGIAYPIICGENSGKHLYVDMGSGNTDTAQINFAFTGTTANRRFDIKVTQVECNNAGRPFSTGCQQYHEGTTGRIESFNYQPAGATTHLASQDYTVCIRQEEGFGCVQYQVCSGVTPAANAFSLTVHADATAMSVAAATQPLTTGQVDNLCTEDFISIDGGMATCKCGAGTGGGFRNRFCGIFLSPVTNAKMNSPVCDCTAPFVVGVHTDKTADGKDFPANTNAAVKSSGFCLEYTQIAC